MTKARILADFISDGSSLADGAISVAEVAGAMAAANNLSDVANATTAKTNLSLATVATTGAYADVTGTPTLATVATTGAYADVTGTPAAALPLTGGTLSGGLNVSSGNVGIGTTSPTSTLHVVGGAYLLNTASPLNMTLQGNTGSVAGIRFQAEEVHGDIQGINSGNNFGGLAFSTNYNGTVSEKMRINESGNVGIGTSSPTHRLDVLNDGGEQLRLLAWDQSASARANIDFWYLDSGGSPYNNAQISTLAAANAGNGNLVFSTRPTSGSLTERMRIDSVGRVTMPYQPAFRVGASSAISYTTGVTLIFQSEAVNIGGSYNASTGRFTAPVSGTYLFSVKLLWEGVSSGFTYDSYITKNGGSGGGESLNLQRQAYQAGYTGTAGYISEQGTGLIGMNANDYVYVRPSVSTSAILHANPNWSYFCGYLIG